MTKQQPDLHTVEETGQAMDAARLAAYRRLAVYVLGLDVATLAAELRTARGGHEQLPLAA